MSGDVFIDTNILVYAHDRDAGVKHDVARGLLKDAWLSPIPPAISVQVLQELFVNLSRRGIPLGEACDIVRDYACWRVVENTVELCLKAVDDVKRWQVSYWDGLILSAARAAKATILWSEDLNEGQDYGGVRVINPLR